MSIFRKPIKTIIVNSPSAQLRIVTDADGDELVEAGEAADATDVILLESLIRFKRSDLRILSGAATRIVVTDYTAPVKQIATFTTSAAPATAGTATFELVFSMLDSSRVEFQGIPLRNFFQITYLASATANTIATKIANTINAIADLPVTASVATNVVTITAEDFGVKFALYDGASDLGVFAVTTPAVQEINGYEQLKNFQWSAPISDSSEFDRMVEYMPVKGATYKSYYFETTADASYIGGHNVADQQLTVINKFRLYANKASASALITQLDLLVTQVNA